MSYEEAVKCGGRKPIATRWVDVNKGDAASPDVRSRLVAKDFAVHRDDSFFAATPPLEALRMLISDMMTEVGSGAKEVKMMVLDAKKAHLHAWAERDLYVVLPEEAGGGCARLVRSLYGTRDAPALWEAYAAAQLCALGFQRGRSNACVYFHRRRGLRCLVHGDDFVATGLLEHLEWMHHELAKTVLLKRVGVLGLDPAKGDVQEVRILNRVLRIDGDGVRYEADPRHAEILSAMLGPGAKAVSTPGLRETLPKEEPLGADVVQVHPEGAKVFSLDESWAPEAGWGPEEEEERYEEAQPEEEESRAACRARPGRRERAAVRGEEAVLDEGVTSPWRQPR